MQHSAVLVIVKLSLVLLQATLETIEAEFWKVVEEAEDPVEVLYGADIDTTITGSGFPQKVLVCPDNIFPFLHWNLYCKLVPGFHAIAICQAHCELGTIAVLCCVHPWPHNVLLPYSAIGFCKSTFAKAHILACVHCSKG